MEQMLYIREGIISFYKKHELIVRFLARFVAYFIIFQLISSLRYSSPGIAVQIPGLTLNFVLALLSAVLPASMSYLLMIAYIALHTSAVLEIMAVVTLALICVLVFYARMAPKESILIIITILAYLLRIPYFVPLLAGLYFGITSVIPVTIGVFVWHSAPIVSSLLSTTNTAGYDLMEIPNTLSVLYIELLNGFGANNQWIFIAFIFGMTIVIVFAVSKLSIDYSKEISIVLGATIMIVSFIISVLISGSNMGIFSMMFFTIVSTVLAFGCRFFDCVLDYSRSEHVEFEDEENYYYVKIIPKVLMARRNRVVRRIRPTPDDFDDYDEYEDERRY